ncbi:MAG: DUF192 domain-containing protein [Candidatus Woesebacteria bacterium]|nr:DUF192 domain-containing protein [Candidatus Woesebacteria bacterium]
MKNFKKYGSFIIVILFLIILGFFWAKSEKFGSSAPKKEPSSHVSGIKYVKIAGQMIKVELALTQKEQEQGLSGRENLKDDEGILFIFSEPAKNYFWMKNMNFPIDIIWLGEDRKIIYIKKDIQPSSYPNSFGPGVDNRYVLEVSAGFSEKNNLKIEDSVRFLR